MMQRPRERMSDGLYDLKDCCDGEESVQEDGDGENEAELIDSVEPAVEDHNSRFSRGQIDTITSVLATLRDANISPIQLTLYILDPTRLSTRTYRGQAYRADNHYVPLLLCSINRSKAGRARFDEWMNNDGMTWVHNRVDKEVSKVAETTAWKSMNSLCPDDIKKMQLKSFVVDAPILTSILRCAAQTKRASRRNKSKDPSTLCDIVIHQLLYQRSHCHSVLQAPMGLFLWSSGTPRQVIDIVHNCGLSISYDSIIRLITSLATKSMAANVVTASERHLLSYDNIDIPISIHVEQGGDGAPAKIIRGTFGILYDLYTKGVGEGMKIEPILKRFATTKGLNFATDVRPSRTSLSNMQHQFKVILIRALTRHVRGFQNYAGHPGLQHHARRALPPGHRTIQHPVRVSNIDEATIIGNLEYHDDLYLRQFMQTAGQLSDWAIPCINDQLTNSRIRSAQERRSADTDAWNRRQVFQLAPGLFHLCLNLVWAVLHIHRGSASQLGTLKYFFDILNGKNRLGKENPDYHTLLMMLMQILDGLALNAWTLATGESNLDTFANSSPSDHLLYEKAGWILQNCATPTPSPRPPPSPSKNAKAGTTDDVPEEAASSAGKRGKSRPKKKRTGKDASGSPASELPGLEEDVVLYNVQCLMRDLLYVAEVVQAIADGDFGRVEDILPQLTMIFQAADSNKYVMEILYLIHNLKHVWTPEFADLMRDNMIINPTGRQGRAMGVDQNIECHINYLKLVTVKSNPTLWQNLGNISVIVDSFSHVKKDISDFVAGSQYHSRTRTMPDVTQSLVIKAMQAAGRDSLQTFTYERGGNTKTVFVVNTLEEGRSKLSGATLKKFNTRIIALARGQAVLPGLESDLNGPGEVIPELGLTVDTNNLDT